MLSARGRTDLERWQKIWEIGVQYSLVTSAAIAAVAALPESTPRKRTALGALTAGVPMFSWSIQVRAPARLSAYAHQVVALCAGSSPFASCARSKRLGEERLYTSPAE